MSDTTYLNELRQRLNFVSFPLAKTFKSDQRVAKGAIMGLRSGYLVAIGFFSAGNTRHLGVLVRFPSVVQPDMVKTLLLRAPGLEKSPAIKTLKVDSGAITASFPITMIKRPDQNMVAGFVDGAVGALGGFTVPFHSACEKCSTKVSEVTLKDDIPCYYCTACQGAIAMEQEQKAQEYRNKPANYPIGILVGVLATLGAGTVWGLAAAAFEAGSGEWWPKLHFAMAIFVILSALAVFKGMGKVTRAGQVIAMVLSLAANFWADFIYFSFVIMHNHDVDKSFFSWPPEKVAMLKYSMMVVAGMFWKIKFQGLHILVSLTEIAGPFLIPFSPLGRIPEFIPTFKPAGSLTGSDVQAISSGTAGTF